jgi:hypothetical protein
MSRSGYSEDYDETFPNAGALYARNVERAAEGRRGQKFFHDLLAALDAMPVKRLITNELAREGEVCALGALGRARDLDMSDLNPEDARSVGKRFGIAQCLAREAVFQNDERGGFWCHKEESPEDRWQRMRNWAEQSLAPSSK